MLTAMFRTVYGITKGCLLKARHAAAECPSSRAGSCPTYVSLFDSFMQHGAKEHKRLNNGGSEVMYLVFVFFCVVKQSITIYVAIYIAAFHATCFFYIGFLYNSCIIDRTYLLIGVICEKCAAAQRLLIISSSQ